MEPRQLLSRSLRFTGCFRTDESVEAAIRTAELRGLNTNPQTDAEADRLARIVSELAPEHRIKAPQYTPAERLKLHDELLRVNPESARRFEAEDPNAIKLARAAREQGRRAIENRRRELNGTAFSIERQLGDARNLTGLRGSLSAAETRLWELRQKPPHVPGVAEQVVTEAVRVEKLRAEVANLERQANEARTQAASLQEV